VKKRMDLTGAPLVSRMDIREPNRQESGNRISKIHDSVDARKRGGERGRDSVCGKDSSLLGEAQRIKRRPFRSGRTRRWLTEKFTRNLSEKNPPMMKTPGGGS